MRRGEGRATCGVFSDPGEGKRSGKLLFFACPKKSVGWGEKEKRGKISGDLPPPFPLDLLLRVRLRLSRGQAGGE